MREVLVATSSGSGVVRTEDGLVLIVADVAVGDGLRLRDGDRYRPALVPAGERSCVVGGLLAPGAVAAEAVDDRGQRIAARVANGAYVVVLEQRSEGAEPVVCCRDPHGHPVSRPRAAGHPGVRVKDADDPCPACDAIDFEEYLPFEGGSSGETDSEGRIVPRPVLHCRVCGHEEQTPIVMRALSGPDRPAATLTPEQLNAQADARRRDFMWQSIEQGVHTQGFSIYAAVGWSARVTQSGSEDDGRLTSVTIAHFGPGEASDSTTRRRPDLTVATERDEPQFTGLLDRARFALRRWARPDPRRGARPGASDAANTLRHNARRRHDHAASLNAVQSEQAIDIDGHAVPVLMLTTAAGGWAAAARHHDLVITVTGHDTNPDSVQLAPIADPEETLGPPTPHA